MQIPNYYMIWCDSPLSRNEYDKIDYYIFKSKYVAKKFLFHFKEMKKLLGIPPDCQQMVNCNEAIKYRSPLDDGQLIFPFFFSHPEKELVTNVIAKLERFDGKGVFNFKTIKAITNGDKIKNDQ